MERADTALREPMAIELNLTVFEKVARSYGWASNEEIAKALGVSERQVSRVRRGKGRPGTAFIAGLLTAAEEVGFRRLFRIVPASHPIGRE